jgi:hypothetical protein
MMPVASVPHHLLIRQYFWGGILKIRINQLHNQRLELGAGCFYPQQKFFNCRGKAVVQLSILLNDKKICQKFRTKFSLQYYL